MKGAKCCNSGKALPIPSQSMTGTLSLAATVNGPNAFIPPISAGKIAVGVSFDGLPL